MFEVGFFELVVIFGVALVVLGPKRLPGLVSKIGRWVGKARRMARDFQEQLENEVNLDELNRMTEARSKPSAPVYPAPPPEFGGEPLQTAAAPETPVDPVQQSAAASTEPSPSSYAPPDPGSTIPPEDASHNDLSENHEQRHERGA
jgi:sec-independent protein translocase protein TatB